MKSALLIIDMINTFDHPEGSSLLRATIPVARVLEKVKKRCETHRVPVIYINDNFGKWRSDWQGIYQRCSSQKSKGRPVAQILKPAARDHFVLKPRHSAFYQTPLESLLEYLRVKHLILTGIAADMCVFFTAQDAHMRGYKVTVLKDGVASHNSTKKKKALDLMEKSLQLSVKNSESLRFS